MPLPPLTRVLFHFLGRSLTDSQKVHFPKLTSGAGRPESWKLVPRWDGSPGSHRSSVWSLPRPPRAVSDGVYFQSENWFQAKSPGPAQEAPRLGLGLPDFLSGHFSSLASFRPRRSSPAAGPAAPSARSSSSVSAQVQLQKRLSLDSDTSLTGSFSMPSAPSFYGEWRGPPDL